MKTNFTKPILLLVLSATIMGNGCDDYIPTLTNVVPEAPGNVCKYGGLILHSGKDRNKNGILEEREIDPARTQIACATIQEGKIALLRFVAEPAGANCAVGGTKITSGLDDDDNGELAVSEIDSTAYVCRASDGINGLNSLVRLIDIPTGSPDCLFGGTRVQSGLDTNNNGMLADTEVTSSQKVCSVRVLDNVRVESSIILPGTVGTPCTANGGVRMRAGVDADENDVLAPNEVTATVDICNTISTIPGRPSLIRTSNASVAQCLFGGFVVQSGLDLNADNTLNDNEVSTTNLLCNGANGYNSIVKTRDSLSNEPCGTRGGTRFDSGLDTNRSGVLDSGEIQNTSYVCDGFTGPTGGDGFTSLITQTADPGVCSEGGVQIDSGLDIDGDFNLDPLEIDYTSYLCNGPSTVILPTVDTIHCEEGGVRLDFAIDYSGDGIIQQNEYYGAPQYLCNGLSGYIVDLNDPVPSFICEFGGVKIETGPDLDFDGELSDSEAVTTKYMCNN